MKTLLVRPGVEIVEKTLKGPWSPELSHLKILYREPTLIFRGLVALESFSSSSMLAVGSILKDLGEDVEFLDVPFEFGIPLTEESNVKKNEKITAYIEEGRYDVVGISCTSVLEGLATRKIAEAAKRASEDITVIVGGYQAAADAFIVMQKMPAVDVIVLSDVEPVAEPLYSSLEGTTPLSTVPNVVYREKDRIRVSQRQSPVMNPKCLLKFDYSLAEKYLPHYAFLTVEASRGCPYNCSFCQEKVLRPSYIVKQAEIAADHLIEAANYIAKITEPVFFYFCDALWGLNPAWVKEFCSQLIERKDQIKAHTFGWGVEARVGQFDEVQLSLMKKAGCFTIGYGVESLSPSMLTLMNKVRNPHAYINSVSRTVSKMLKADIQAVLLFILGMPGETPHTLRETLKALKNLPLQNENLHLQFGLPFALQGTLLERQLHNPHFRKKYGVQIIDEFDWEKVYLPRLTLLFDPSRELSAFQMTAAFLDITTGTEGMSSSLERQSKEFEEVSTVLDRDEISPENLQQWGAIYRNIVSKIQNTPEEGGIQHDEGCTL